MGRGRRVRKVSADPVPDTLLGSVPVRTLDLHGLTAEEAKRRVRDFIATCTRAAAGQVVRIVTGKGKGSAGRPVLEPLVRELLQTSLAKDVAKFTVEPGGGSYLVRMR